MPDGDLPRTTSNAGTAVVTGGGTGIGREVARSFAADGWRVVVVGRRRAVLDALAREVGSTGEIVPVAGDLTVTSDVERVASKIQERLGTVDVLVLNAGGTSHGPQATVKQVADHWLTTFSQNALSAVLLEHALRPHLRRPGGRVVVISSFSARTLAGNAAYGASKAALHRWVLALGDELGSIGSTANAVAPGFVPDTELFGDRMTPERVTRISERIGVRRAGTPQDIAGAVRWLTSPAASFVNGTVLEVDGGVRRQD